MNKLDIAKQLFEFDQKIIKDIMGIFYKEVSFDELPVEAIKYYRFKTNRIISMVKNLNET